MRNKKETQTIRKWDKKAKDGSQTPYITVTNSGTFSMKDRNGAKYRQSEIHPHFKGHIKVSFDMVQALRERAKVQYSAHASGESEDDFIYLPLSGWMNKDDDGSYWMNLKAEQSLPAQAFNNITQGNTAPAPQPEPAVDDDFEDDIPF